MTTVISQRRISHRIRGVSSLRRLRNRNRLAHATKKRLAVSFSPQRNFSIARRQTIGREIFEIAQRRRGWLARFRHYPKNREGPRKPQVPALSLCTDGAPSAYVSAQTINPTARTSFREWRRKNHRCNAGPNLTNILSFVPHWACAVLNNLYYQYTVLSRIYDWRQHSGFATIPRLIPQR